MPFSVKSRRRIACALAGAILTMFSLGSLYAWSVFVAPLESLLGEPRSAISAVFSIANLGFMLGLLAAPHLQRRRSAPLNAVAAFALATLGLSVCGAWPSIWTLWLGYGGLFGLANGFGYGLSLQVAQLALPARRGLATGIVVASYTAGAAAFAPLFEMGIAGIGAAATLVGAAAFMAASGIAVAALLQGSAVDLPGALAAGPKLAAVDANEFRILWLGFLCGSLAGLLVLGHAAAIVAVSGGSTGQAALGVALVALGNCLGRLAGGWASDGRHAEPKLGLLLLAAAGALLAVATLPGVTAALSGLAVVGLGYGWMAGAYPAIVATRFGVARMGRLYGRIMTAWGIAGIAAPYIGGALFDIEGSYRLAAGLAAAAALCGGIILMMPVGRDRSGGQTRTT